MANGKRSFSKMAAEDQSQPPSPFMPMFETFRQELDEHHDRRERIIKSSRDVTAASKKIIFTLQRVRKIGEPLADHVHKSNKQYYDNIKLQLSNVTKDVQGVNYYRYAKQLSPGCQEYMEAALFEHYLSTGMLLTFEEALTGMARLSEQEDGTSILLTPEDYLLGLFDMTGELMRFAVTTMATSGSLPTFTIAEQRRDVLNDLRNIRAALEQLEFGFGPFAKEADKKMDVMKQSVEKVERSLYGLTVRGSERPKGWMPSLSTTEIES